MVNPKNEEAVFSLAKLKLVTSDYEKAKKLVRKLKLICINLCDKSNKLKIEIENLTKKINAISSGYSYTIDFGSQVIKLITRRVRELSVWLG